ncbi:MAG: YdeI/OmpD-associated family protein [Paludibacter sp.]
MNPVFFENQSEFRKWLVKNHLTEKELVVGFYKVNSVKPSMTWSESVDQAICFGWIDSIRKTLDNESYSIRFSPRNPKSIWSEINIKKVENILEKGLMTPKGLELFKNRKEDKSALYSYENKPLELPSEFRLKLESNKEAFDFFDKQSATYKKTAYFWVLSAKLEETRTNRLEKLIVKSEKHQKIF